MKYPLVLLLLRNANYNYGKYQEKIASKPLLVFFNVYVFLIERDRDRLAGEAGGVFRSDVLLRLRRRIKNKTDYTSVSSLAALSFVKISLRHR